MKSYRRNTVDVLFMSITWSWGWDLQASRAAGLSAEELDRRDEQRATQGAHDSVVPSSGGAALARGRGYNIGALRSRATPSWRQR